MARRVTSSVGWKGHWDPVTSTLDWCEANYQFSYYIAEMANTFSNLATISISFTAAYLCLRESLPLRYFVGFLLIGLVGIGSCAFHATLLYQAQLADELPMIFAATYLVFLLSDTRPEPILSPRRLLIITVLVLFDALFSLSYVVYRNPAYHQAVFATMVLFTAIRIQHLLKTRATSIPTSLKRDIPAFFWTGSGLFLLAFIIWSLDNTFCDTLTTWRIYIGWPVAFMLEGHSWWHVLTGVGSYLMILGISCLNLCLREDHRKFTIGRMLGLPYIRRVQEKKTD